MTKLDYRTPPRRGDSVEFSEFAVPLGMLVLGLIVYGAWGFMAAGAVTAGATMGIIFMIAAMETVLGIGVAYAVAAMLGTSFGELRTAFLKLAGILVLSGGLGMVLRMMLPFGGFAILAIYLGLLVWQFELEMYEAVVFAIVLGIARFVLWLFLLAWIM